MKRRIMCMVFAACYSGFLFSQKDKKELKKDNNHAVSVEINLPAGNFSSTHTAGFAVGYSPARHRFSLVKNKYFAFTYNGAVAWYPGKKETVSSYPYQYPGYLFIHAFAGLLYNPAAKIDFRLIAGPALGNYNADTRFNLGARLEGNYLLKSKFIISPGIILMKEKGAGPLWACSFKFGYLF